MVTLVLCSLALWPLFVQRGLPNGDDVLYHVYRAAEMDRSWTHGVFLPRWAETFYTGYGSPLFNYYASLTYYLTSLLSRLFAWDAVDALRAVIVISLLGGGAGMYGFTRGLAGRPGGILAAVIYVYSPYLVYTEPYSRGAYPELLAFGLFPTAMWAYRWLRDSGRGGAFAAAALGSGALILTHNLMALVLSGLLVAWLVWEAVLGNRQDGQNTASLRTHNAAVPFAALAVGVGLAAFFWLPVMQEGGAVKLANLTGTAELNYQNFFVPAAHLLAASPRHDLSVTNALEHQLNLGVAQWGLGLLGTLGTAALGLRSRRVEWTAIFFTLAAAGLIFLIEPAAAPVWKTLTPMAFLQFPWRLLGPAVFCLAVLGGMNAIWIARLPRQWGKIIPAGMVVVVIGLAAPTLVIPEWIYPTVDTSAAAYHAAELKGFQRATTFSNEYLPQTVAVEPDATPRLLADYADGYPVNKAHLEALPPDVTVEVVDHGPQHDVWRVRADVPFVMEVLTYYFPGWTAEIDGQAVSVTASEPHGLIQFPVPAGEHTVRLWLGGTLARDLGTAISLLSLAVLVAGGIWLGRGRHSAPSRQDERWDAIPFVVGGAAALVFLIVVMRPGGAWEQSAPGEARLAQQAADYRLGNWVRLVGYDLNGTTFRAGGRMELRVYWAVEAAIPYGYASFVHLTQGGPPAAQADKLNPAGLPTKLWPVGGLIQDDYVIELPETLAPGDYTLYAGLYTCDTRPAGECGNGERLTVTDAAGTMLGDAVPLAAVRIVP